MKKTIWIWIVTALILLAIIPIPTGVYKDGGTREYTALTYKIVDWHHLYGLGQTYDTVKVYPFPFNFYSIDALLEKEEKNFENTDISFVSAEPSKVHCDTYGINCQYIRIDGKTDTYPKSVIIRSRQELDSYISQCVEQHEYNQWGKSFKDACKVYDDAYFQERILVLVLLEEGSGSIRHKVTNVYTDDEGYLNIKINVIIPQIGTCDMAYWHIFVEPDKDVDITDPAQIRLYFENVCEYNDHTPAPEPQLVDDPITGYCGNTQTTVYLQDNKPFTFMGSQSVALTKLLNDLEYDLNLWCNCQAQYKVDTEFGLGYEISLAKAFVRCNEGQAPLTQEQIEQIEDILAWVSEQEESP